MHFNYFYGNRPDGQGGEVLHLMSAFASEARMALAVEPVADKKGGISTLALL